MSILQDGMSGKNREHWSPIRVFMQISAIFRAVLPALALFLEPKQPKIVN